MTVRHAALSIGAVLVLGLGVYLLVEVRAQPAAPMTLTLRADEPPDERARGAAPAARVPAPARIAPAAAGAAGTPPGSPGSGGTPGAAGLAASGAEAGAQDAEALTGPRLDAAMAEANTAYDRGDYDDARTLASRLLARQPGNVRMLRILVSSSCIEGDAAAAQASYEKLPPGDQAQMRVRCARYGVSFPVKP